MRRALLLGSAASGPILDLNFADGSALDGRISFARASGAAYYDATGTLQTAANNAARFDYGPLAVTTNAIRNSTMQGAVPGTPGTAPTNWTVNVPAGVSSQIVGTGTESGIPYVDIRFFGNSNAAPSIVFEANNGVPALVGQTWTQSVYLKLVGGSFTNIANLQLFSVQYSSTGVFLAATTGTLTGAVGTGSLATQRFAATATLPQATTAYLNPEVWFGCNGAVDITLRVGAPQLEQTPAVSPIWVPTSGASNSAIATPGGRTNRVPNSTFANVVGTGWGPGGGGTQVTAGVTASIVGSGTVSGMNYLDVRFNGTPTASNTSTRIVLANVPNLLPVSQGMSVTASVYAAIVAGSLTNISTNGLELPIFSATGFVSNFNPAFALTSTLTRFTSGGVITSASAVHVSGIDMNFTVTSGSPIDMTIRIAGPQLEVGNTATAFIPTTSAPVTVGALPLGLLIEEQRTNGVRNPRCEGAVAGTPGTLPTNMTMGNAGLTTQVVAASVSQSGIPCFDLRVFGTTNTTSLNILFETATGVAAANGQTWTASTFLRVLGGNSNVTGLTLRGRLSDTSGAYLGELVVSPPSVLTSISGTSLYRASTSGTIANASTLYIAPYIQLTFANGAVIDFTIRIGAPQMEQGASPTSPILPAVGTPAATTRAADVASLSANYAPNGTLAVDFFETAGTGTNQFIAALNTGSDINNEIRLFVNNALNFSFGQAVGGSGPADTSLATVTVGAKNKIAGTWSTSNIRSQGNNGTASQSTTTGGVPVYDTLWLGKRAPGYFYADAPISRVRLWSRALSLTELQAVTT